MASFGIFLFEMLMNVRQLDPFGLWTVDGYFLVLRFQPVHFLLLFVSHPLNVYIGTVSGSLGPLYTHSDCCGLRCVVLFIGRLFIDGVVIMM